MQTILGIVLILFPGILYVGQLISSIDFARAQRLGLQEDPQHTDPLLQRAERYAAYWDLFTLGWMPLAGVLMLLDRPAWPYVALVAAAIYIDTAGREAAKTLSFKHEGVRVGPPGQHRWFFATYLVMGLLGLVVGWYALMRLVG